MLKDRLLKLLPKPETLRENRALKPVAHLLQRKELWQVNRRSVASAVFVGLFSAFIPVPSQMLLAAVISIFVRVKLTYICGASVDHKPCHYGANVLFFVSTRCLVTRH